MQPVHARHDGPSVCHSASDTSLAPARPLMRAIPAAMNGWAGNVASAARLAAARASARTSGSAATAIPAAANTARPASVAATAASRPSASGVSARSKPTKCERPRIHVAAEAAVASGETVDHDDERLLAPFLVARVAGEEAVLIGERGGIAGTEPEERERGRSDGFLGERVTLPAEHRLARREENRFAGGNGRGAVQSNGSAGSHSHQSTVSASRRTS